MFHHSLKVVKPSSVTGFHWVTPAALISELKFGSKFSLNCIRSGRAKHRLASTVFLPWTTFDWPALIGRTCESTSKLYFWKETDWDTQFYFNSRCAKTCLSRDYSLIVGSANLLSDSTSRVCLSVLERIWTFHVLLDDRKHQSCPCSSSKWQPLSHSAASFSLSWIIW